MTCSTIDRGTGLRARQIFTEIASIALTVRQIGHEIVCSDDARRTADLATTVMELSEKIGWLADLGADKLGAVQLIGGAEAWMMHGRAKEEPSIKEAATV